MERLLVRLVKIESHVKKKKSKQEKQRFSSLGTYYNLNRLYLQIYATTLASFHLGFQELGSEARQEKVRRGPKFSFTGLSSFPSSLIMLMAKW